MEYYDSQHHPLRQRHPRRLIPSTSFGFSFSAFAGHFVLVVVLDSFLLIEFGNLTSVKQFVHDSGLNFEDMISIAEDALKDAFGGDVDASTVMSAVEDHMSTISLSIDADIRPAQEGQTEAYKTIA